METNKIYHGDCLELIKEIPDKSIDLLYTDPPYNQEFSGGGSCGHSYDYRKEEMVKLSSFDPISFLELVKPKLKNFHAYIWTNKGLLREYLNWINDNGFSFDILIWVKKSPIPACNHKYLSDVEYCIFIRGKDCHWTTGLGYEKYKKVMTTEKGANNTYGHPTQKYLWMVKKMIEVSTKKGDLVFDPFMGSGTTILACKELQRNYIGIELETKYFEMAQSRLRQDVLL